MLSCKDRCTEVPGGFFQSLNKTLTYLTAAFDKFQTLENEARVIKYNQHTVTTPVTAPAPGRLHIEPPPCLLLHPQHRGARDESASQLQKPLENQSG